MGQQKIKILFLSLIFSFLIIISLSFAKEQEPIKLEYPPPGGPQITGKGALQEYAQALLNLILAMAGLILFGVIVYGGFLYLTSAIDPQKKEEGKRKIVQGFVGLALLLLLYLFYNALWGKGGVSVPPPPKWPEFEISGVYGVPQNVSLDKQKEVITKGTKVSFENVGERISENTKIAIFPHKGEYREAVIISPKFERRKLEILGIPKAAYYIIGKESDLKKAVFEKGPVLGPGYLIVLLKSSAPSGAGINFCACGTVFEAPSGEIYEKTCMEWLKELKGVNTISESLCAEVPLNGDFQQISPPKQGIFDFSKDTRTFSVDEGITAILCAQNQECLLLQGPITISDITQLPQDFWDIIFVRNLAIPESKIKTIYLFRANLLLK